MHLCKPLVLMKSEHKCQRCCVSVLSLVNALAHSCFGVFRLVLPLGPRSVTAFHCLLHAAFLLDWLPPPDHSHPSLSFLGNTCWRIPKHIICSKRRAAWWFDSCICFHLAGGGGYFSIPQCPGNTANKCKINRHLSFSPIREHMSIYLPGAKSSLRKDDRYNKVYFLFVPNRE